MPATTRQIIGGIGYAYQYSARYCPLFGGQDYSTTNIYAEGIASTAGIIKNLRVELNGSPGAGTSFDIILLKNGVTTLLTVNIADSATTGNNLSDEITVAAGDYLCIKTTPNNYPTTRIPTWVVDFVPTTPGETLLLAYSGGILNNQFGSVIGGFTHATEFNTQLLIPCPGIISNFYIRSSAAAGSGKTLTYTILKNGVAQTLTTSLTGTSQVTNNDIVNSFTVVAGDKISIQRTGDSTVTNAYLSTGLTFTPDTQGNFILGYLPGTNVMSTNSIQYTGVDFYGDWDAGVDTTTDQIFAACTIKNIYVELSAAPDNGGGTQAFIFTLRKGAASQGLTVTISEAATTGNASEDISIADNDMLDTMKTLTGTPTASVKALISYTGYIAPEAATITKTILSDVHIKAINIQKTITSDATIAPIKQTIQSDAHIKAINIQKTITSDATIIASVQKVIFSDAHIKAVGIQKTITSDAMILAQYQKTIFSDAHIKAAGILKTILSNATIAIEVLYDINNKISTVKQVLSNINNKFSLAKRVFSDVVCFINTVKGSLYNINNKINTKAQKLYDVNNDVRFIKSWQKAGTFGFQSLGKSYIKVFIATVEQTDVDVDSINIHKQLNSAHTASFDLARTYDNSTVPAAEAIIEIRYYHFGMADYWLLFKGYVTSVSPSDSPESITVNCQDEYWKTNQTNKYFFVGHNPYDNREKYYSTIREALLTELGWSLSIGDFVPEIIDCFGQGQSDIVSSLIEQTGNYGWFYDVDGIRKLWTAGQGSQVNIDRQEIGKNIDIYQLIDHKITTTSENVINRYRVQMGQKTGRGSQGSRQYEVYTCSNFEGQAIPAWDRSLEKLAKKGTSNGYGFNYTGLDNADTYKDVFRKFSIPSLDSDTESWSDRYPPKVEVFNPGGWGGSVYGFPMAGGVIKEGFTIDYENRFITFNEPIFLTYTNNYGEVTAIRAPVLRVSLWKEIYHTYTASESEDAGNTVSNPYMFFRDSTGFIPTPTYPNTITKLLNLTGLTHQDGMTYIDYWGVSHTIRNFDDTDYAEDYIDWQLSNTCDAKINGTFTLTLDALCFNNIDLSKRIYINGITAIPLNIVSISYNLANFTVSIEVENKRYYQRTVSIPRHD